MIYFSRLLLASLAVLTCLQTAPLVAQTSLSTRESDYFVKRVGSRKTTFRGTGRNNAKDSNDLNALLSRFSRQGGGTVTITGPNKLFLKDIKLRSKIHLQVKSGITIEGRSGFKSVVFSLGEDARISNVGITSAGSGRFTIKGGANTNSFVGVDVERVTNFLISDINIRLNRTVLAGIEMAPVNLQRTGPGRDGPRSGLIKNITCTGNNRGYGLTQVRGVDKALFKNLRGSDGTTLRLESGIPSGVGNANATIKNVVARGITQTVTRNTGREPARAVYAAPHRINQGIIDCRGLNGFCVIADGFKDRKGTVNNIGVFDSRGFMAIKRGGRGRIDDTQRPECPKGCMRIVQSNGKATPRKR